MGQGRADHRRGRRVASRLAMITAGLVVGLLLAEVLARLVGPQGPEFVLDATTTVYDPNLYISHPELITALAPGADVTLRAVEYETRVRVNALGLRGPEVGPKPRGALRVLAVGDSFTLGVQVPEDQTFSAVLAGSLGAALGRPVEVLNAGVDGYGTVQATRRMTELVRQTGADVVVLTFFLGNDIRDNVRYPERAAAARAQPRRPPPPTAPPTALEGELAQMQAESQRARWSRLYAWIQVVRALRTAQTDFRLQEYRDELAVFTDAALRGQQLGATRDALAGFGQACAQLRVRCVLALAPPAWAVHDDRRDATFDAFGLDGGHADSDGLAREVAALAPRNVEVVDLSAPLRAAAGERLYLTFDPHWSGAGHAVVGHALSAALAGTTTP